MCFITGSLASCTRINKQGSLFCGHGSSKRFYERATEHPGRRGKAETQDLDTPARKQLPLRVKAVVFKPWKLAHSNFNCLHILT